MDKQEQIVALKELRQHRGWVLFLGLSEQWRKQKKEEQAVILRQRNPEERKDPVYVQGEVDGSLYTTNNLIEEFIKNPEEGEQPTY